MTSSFVSSTLRLRVPAALLAVAIGLAACADDAPPPAENAVEDVVLDETSEPDVEEAAVAPPVANETAVDNAAGNAADAAPVRLDEEPVTPDQQTIEDADATGMTSRYAGDESGSEAAPGNETAPAE